MEYLKKINLKNILLVIFVGILMQLFASTLLTEIIKFFPATSEEYSDTIDTLTKLTMRMVFFTCVVAPVLEEFIFRGVIMQLAQFAKMPFIAANLIQAAGFSFYHDNIVQKIYAFILGIFIGYLVYRLGNIIYGVAFHFSMNLAGVLEQNFLGEIGNIVIEVLITIASAACIVFIMLYILKNNQNAKLSNNGSDKG